MAGVHVVCGEKGQARESRQAREREARERSLRREGERCFSP